MKKIKYLFLSLFIILSTILLSACSFFDIFDDKTTEKKEQITICYINGDKKTYKTYDDYKDIVFETYSTETGYEFKGWSIEENGSVISKDDLKGKTSITLYPVISLINYSIEYDLDGGSNNINNPTTYTIEDEITIYSPTKDDYAFTGWYVNDSTTLVSSYTITKGSYGNIKLKANYVVGKISVVFNYPGIEDQIIDYNSKCVKPADPEKAFDTFVCWCSDESLQNEFDFDTILKSSITLYPKWSSTKFYSLTINNSEYVKSNYESGQLLPSNTTIHLETNYINNGKEFVGYYIDEKLITRNYVYELKMPESNLTITPMYNDLTTYSYTKGVDTKLAIPVDEVDNYLFGSNVSDSDYNFESGKLVLKSSYLDTLDLGLHTYVYNFDTLIYVFIKSSNIKATNIFVDYDINYPKATLLFDEVEGYEYSYSLDGSEYNTCYDGLVFDINNKYISHNIDIKCGSNVTNYTVEAIPTEALEYVTKTFTYNGNTYDFYVDSIDDLNVLLEYEALAQYPSIKGTSYTFKFYYPNGGSSSAKEAYKHAINRLISVPYGLTYEYYQSKEVTFIMHSNDTFNSLATTQERIDITNTVFKESSRSSDFDGFYIERCSKTQEIRSIYELENLNVGIKPIISDNKTLTLYNKAKEILREYVDDSFSVYEKLKAIYDYIASNVTYDDALLLIDGNLQSDYQSFTSYSALINGIAVCDGFASAFKLLCTIEGIECIEVVGSAKGGGHAWNKVKINDVWYGVDSTWSRSNFNGVPYVYHAYFLIDETVLMNYAGANHYEQATRNADDSYSYFNVVNTASNNLDYFDLFIYGEYDLVCSSENEYRKMYNYFASNSFKYVEIKLDGITYSDISGIITGIYQTYYSVYHTTSDPYRIYLIH